MAYKQQKQLKLFCCFLICFKCRVWCQFRADMQYWISFSCHHFQTWQHLWHVSCIHLNWNVWVV